MGTGGRLVRRVGVPTTASVIAVATMTAWSAGVSSVIEHLLGATVVVGLVLGGLTTLVLRLRFRGRAVLRVSVARLLLESLLVAVVLEALVVAHAMARSPSLYAARFYARGGLSRTVQVLATDVAGTYGIIAIGFVLLLLYLRPRRGRVARDAARVAPAALGVVVWLAFSGSDGARSSLAPAQQAASMDRGERDAAPRAGAPNVVLLVVRSLRADRLTPALMPNVTHLATRGAKFEHAYVSTASDRASWSTLTTGREVHAEDVDPSLARDLPALVEALPAQLARVGYRSRLLDDGEHDGGLAAERRALASATALLPFLHTSLGRARRPAMRTLDGSAEPTMLATEASRAIHDLRQEPFLLTVSFAALRSPLTAPRWTARSGRAYRGPFKYTTPVLPSAPDAPAHADDDDARQLRTLYDGAVYEVDHAIGDILLALEREGLRERTVVVVTSDHGEDLLEVGRGFGHDDPLFGDAVLHVPLVVVDPRSPVVRTDETNVRIATDLVRDVDVAATLRELTALPPLTGRGVGRSLVPYLRSLETASRPFVYSTAPSTTYRDVPAMVVAIDRNRTSSPRRGAPAFLAGMIGRFPLPPVARDMPTPELLDFARASRLHVIRDERWKLVAVPTRHGRSTWLFDTMLDPEETRDASPDHADEERRLARALAEHLASETPAVEAPNVVLVSFAGAAAAHITESPAWKRLAARGVTFTEAYASATDREGGVTALLTGARPSEVRAWRAGEAAELPRLVRSLAALGLSTRSVVAGEDVPRGLFEGYATVTADRRGLDAVMTDYVLGRAPSRSTTRSFLYVGDDDREASGRPRPDDRSPRPEEVLQDLLDALDRTELTDHTVVVVTSAHGSGEKAAETRVPLVIVAPGLLPASREVKARVRTIDIAPTILELLSAEPHARTSGRSLVALTRSRKGDENDPREALVRPVVIEGQHTRALIHGDYHQIASATAADGTSRLYDVKADPNELHDLTRERSEVAAEMKARLAAALANEPAADAPALVVPPPGPRVLRLRFATQGRARRVSGSVTIGPGEVKARSFQITPVGIAADAIGSRGAATDLAFTTSADALVGLDIAVDPPTTPVGWTFYVDDRELGASDVFAGPFGTGPIAELLHGVQTDVTRIATNAPRIPVVDPTRDFGLFVARTFAAP